MASHSISVKSLLRFGTIAVALTWWTATATQTYNYTLVAQTGQTIGGQKIFDFSHWLPAWNRRFWKCRIHGSLVDRHECHSYSIERHCKVCAMA